MTTGTDRLRRLVREALERAVVGGWGDFALRATPVAVATDLIACEQTLEDRLGDEDTIATLVEEWRKLR